MKPGFYCMDCMEAMPTFPDRFFDIAIVDPPYFSGPERRKYYGSEISSVGIKRKEYDILAHWKVPGKEYFDQLLRISKHYIIWGCNYFDYPFAPGRIIWDKCNGKSSFSDAEIAATDMMDSVRIFPYMWNGMQQGVSAQDGRTAQGNKKLNEVRIHVTQKPIALYTYLLAKFAKPGMKLIDTHVDSASSLLACRRADIAYWGFEIDPVMYEKASARLKNEESQLRMDLGCIDAFAEIEGTDI